MLHTTFFAFVDKLLHDSLRDEIVLASFSDNPLRLFHTTSSQISDVNREVGLYYLSALMLELSLSGYTNKDQTLTVQYFQGLAIC